MNTLPVHVLRALLQDAKPSAIARATGLSRWTIQNFRDNRGPVSETTIEKVSTYYAERLKLIDHGADQ